MSPFEIGITSFGALVVMVYLWPVGANRLDA